mmetsp:Transcript_21539/g.61651  ORF Transcript_21539/g.61651 Transcript_21539/m.61651 type:complete len:223 (-) Transcript_21539:339-1007(-)
MRPGGGCDDFAHPVFGRCARALELGGGARWRGGRRTRRRGGGARRPRRRGTLWLWRLLHEVAQRPSAITPLRACLGRHVLGLSTHPSREARAAVAATIFPGGGAQSGAAGRACPHIHRALHCGKRRRPRCACQFGGLERFGLSAGRQDPSLSPSASARRHERPRQYAHVLPAGHDRRSHRPAGLQRDGRRCPVQHWSTGPAHARALAIAECARRHGRRGERT